MKKIRITLILVALACGVTACGDKKPAPQPPPDGIDQFVLKAAPAGAQSVIDVRGKAKSGDAVTVAGIIGGRDHPFSDGLAVFTLVDAGAKRCKPGECNKPWDFCCVPSEELAKSTVTIEVHQGGKPLRAGLQGVAGLEPMKEIVVTGEARRDDAGNVLVVAKGFFVKP